MTRTENAYTDKMTDLTGGGHLRRLKHSLFRLKKQCEEMGVSEGVMHQTIFSAGGMRQGKHHLYDQIIDEGAHPGQSLDEARDEDFD